jgi:hypothetical protein
MKKNLLLSILLTTTMFCFAQKKDKREGNYSIQLISVDVPKDIQIGKVDTIASTYEDATIMIKWQYAISQIGFDLNNKSDQTLKLVWDDAAFISTENESGRIFHKGIKYIDRENPQSPTSIYKNTTLSDLVSPTSNTYYVSGQYGGWTSRPIIPTMAGGFSKKVEYKPELLGKTLRVALPFKMDDKTLEYVFVFKTVFLEKK